MFIRIYGLPKQRQTACVKLPIRCTSCSIANLLSAPLWIIESSDNRGSDNRGSTVHVHVADIIAAAYCWYIHVCPT